MNNTATILSDIIIMISTGVSFLLTFICLFHAQGANKSGNRWLSIFMLCIFLDGVGNILVIAGIKVDNDFVLEILNFPAFIFAPAFYYTVSYFITPDRKWKIKDYFHLFSTALFHVSLLFYATLLCPNVLLGKQTPGLFLSLYYIGAVIITIMCYTQIIYCCILSWLKLKKHEKDIRSFASTVENTDLKWLRYILISIFIMAFFFVLDNIIRLPYWYTIISQLIYLIGYFIISYFLIKQREIYPFTSQQKKEIIYEVIGETLQKQTRKKLIDDNKLEELKTTLLHIMKNKKPFLDWELSLVKLASIMDISSHQLSYLINTGFNENFYQFINRYRIEEAKRLILDEKMSHLNFQGIALEVGFNSKSVFNAIFKKSTGQTPSEYKIANNM